MKKKIIITAGGTSEPIDNVRKITNSSTGKLGQIICDTLLLQKESEIEKIYYMCPNNTKIPKPNDKIELIYINKTMDLKEKTEQLLKEQNIDIFIHSMAVSDYTTDYVTTAKLLSEDIINNQNHSIEQIIKDIHKGINIETKISSYEDNLIIKLKPTPKIISLIKQLNKDIFLVGFKLLNNVSEQELYDTSYKLLKHNNCNLVIGNDLHKIKNGNHEAILIKEDGTKIGATNKEDIATKLINILF